MRTVFLHYESVMQPLGRMFTAADAILWLYQLAESLRRHDDVEVVLFGSWNEAFPQRSGEAVIHALGKWIGATATPRGTEGAIEGYLSRRPDIVDFVVLADGDAELAPPLHPYHLLAALDKGLWDPSALELRQWLDGTSELPDTAALGSRLDSDVVDGQADTSRALPRRPEPVRATVVLVVEEFEVVHLEGPDGLTLSVGEGTEGVDWRQLQPGQQLECELEGIHGVRVVRAKALPAATPTPATGAPGGSEA